ncbi:MAG: hypothetical protein M1839_001308 [Geoglossum umbratile]|nr:MAG: hypothetical protein M1839_001308 [Geoglossum umbratile]
MEPTDSNPFRPSLEVPQTSTPVRSSAGSNVDALATERGNNMFNRLNDDGGILVEDESSSQSIVEHFLTYMNNEWKAHADKHLRSLQALVPFIRSGDRKKTNGEEFSALISAVASTLDKGNDVQFVQSGSDPIYARAMNQLPLGDRKTEDEDRSQYLKPDYFTSKIRYDRHGRRLPGSYSAVLASNSDPEPASPNPPSTGSTPAVDLSAWRKGGRLKKAKLSQETKLLQETRGSSSTSNPYSLLRNRGSFYWEDVQVLWEIKSHSMAGIDRRAVWGNLILKATEVLRYQWYRKFVLGFLVCGTDICMLRIDRSRVLVSRTVGIEMSPDSTPTLIRCILASLVLPQTALGFPRDNFIRIEYKGDNKPCLVARVGDEELVLGQQILFVQRDRLIT